MNILPQQKPASALADAGFLCLDAAGACGHVVPGYSAKAWSGWRGYF